MIANRATETLLTVLEVNKGRRFVFCSELFEFAMAANHTVITAGYMAEAITGAAVDFIDTSLEGASRVIEDVSDTGSRLTETTAVDSDGPAKHCRGTQLSRGRKED